MTTRIISSLFISITLGCWLVVPAAAETILRLRETLEEISGYHADTDIQFRSRRASEDRVMIDVTVGSKQIRADLDYRLQQLRINGYGSKLSASEITAFHQLFSVLPEKISTESRLGDALLSFVNLMSRAPSGYIINLDRRSNSRGAPGFTSMCDQIGGNAVATYRLISGIQNTPVTVGPTCYSGMGLGRCGSGVGPDEPIIIDGFRQRYTQECLNHDQCCYATRDRYLRLFGKVTPLNICGSFGSECVPEFEAAAVGFFFAPDCGRTTGTWADSLGNSYALTGGNSSGNPRPFSGTMNTVACGVWEVSGTRTATSIEFWAGNPTPTSTCASAIKFVGEYNDCDAAAGTWNDAFGNNGEWSWSRTSRVGQR